MAAVSYGNVATIEAPDKIDSRISPKIVPRKMPFWATSHELLQSIFSGAGGVSERPRV